MSTRSCALEALHRAKRRHSGTVCPLDDDDDVENLLVVVESSYVAHQSTFSYASERYACSQPDETEIQFLDTPQQTKCVWAAYVHPAHVYIAGGRLQSSFNASSLQNARPVRRRSRTGTKTTTAQFSKCTTSSTRCLSWVSPRDPHSRSNITKKSRKPVRKATPDESPSKENATPRGRDILSPSPTPTPVSSPSKAKTPRRKKEDPALAHRLALANALFTELNTDVFGSRITGVEIKWNPRFLTTAGRAKWKKCVGAGKRSAFDTQWRGQIARRGPLVDP